MDFFERANAAGAAEYGRVRAEKYGRRAKWGRALGVLAVLVLLFGCYLAGSGALGG